FDCSLVMLASGNETPRYLAENVPEHILYVVEGQPTIRFRNVNTILSQDQALLVPKGSAHTIAAGPSQGAKLLRVEIPPRPETLPQIITLNS
ncbi:MAG: AraC family ligand binding domain-containing protein, partial [Opitutaceae bacterium]